jgi:hypothetical protein
VEISDRGSDRDPFGGTPAVGGGLKGRRDPAETGHVTISRDIAPVPAPETVLGAPSPRTPQEPTAVVVPTQPSLDMGDRVRRAAVALRAATRNGTVHHHRHPGVPRNRRAPGIEVVRAWADGRDLDAQRRACRTCTPAAR